MSIDANKRIIQQLIEDVWRQGRLDVLPLFWTADCINHADPAPEKQGIEALRRYHERFGPWFQDFSGIVIDLLQQVAESETVTTQIRLQAEHKPTQRQISFDTIRIDRIAGGRIAEHWSIADMAGSISSCPKELSEGWW